MSVTASHQRIMQEILMLIDDTLSYRSSAIDVENPKSTQIRKLFLISKDISTALPVPENRTLLFVRVFIFSNL